MYQISQIYKDFLCRIIFLKWIESDGFFKKNKSDFMLALFFIRKRLWIENLRGCFNGHKP